MQWIENALARVKMERGGNAPFVTININPTPTTWAKLLFTRAEIESSRPKESRFGLLPPAFDELEPDDELLRELIVHKAGTVRHHEV